MSEGVAPGGGGVNPVPVPSSPPGNQQQLVDSFRSITSSSPAEALFFLESHAWQLEAALQSFFDDGEDEEAATRSLPSAAPTSVASRRRRRQLSEEEDEDEGGNADEDDEDYVPSSADGQPRPATRSTAAAMASSSGSGKPSSGPSRGASGSRPAGGIRTLADLNRRSGYGSGSDSDDDSDRPQEYYTGGEKSGMLVQDPKGNADVDAIFEQARQMATQEPVESLRQSSSSRSFKGTGRLLSGETVEVTPQPPESVVHDVIFWSNGFTVDDGPLRRFDDPENASFLESIKRSECPKELEPADRRTAVHVSLSRREEKCPEPAKRFNPFGGAGRTLGSGSSTSLPAAAPVSAPSSAAGLHVDDALPSTSIQLRLADGTRMVARFNLHHTVGDIRGFIDASRPGAARSYQLQTVGFPPKQLTDMTQTIEQAGLTNSVVIQKP